MSEKRKASLNPEHAIEGDNFDLDCQIKNATQTANEDHMGLVVHRCSRHIKWSIAYLSKAHNTSMAHVARLAIHHGVKKLLGQEFVATIDDVASRVFGLSTDPDDRAWFENGAFPLAAPGERPFHIYVPRQDIELCGKLGGVMGVAGYVIRQLALSAGLIYSSSLPKHAKAAMAEDVTRFLQWGHERARKAERELQRVKEEAAARPRPTAPEVDGRDVFGD